MAKRPDRKTQVLARMRSASDTSHRPDAAIQIYGTPGWGKTTIAAALAQQLKDGGDILWIDSSDGFAAVMDEAWATEDVIYGGEHFPAEDLTALATALAESRDMENEFSTVRVLVLDEFSSWYREVLEVAARDRTGTNDDDNAPETIGTDHSLPAALLESVFMKFHRIPNLHVIVVAHAREKTEKIPGGTRKVYHPHYPPLMNINIAAKLHSSVFLEGKTNGKGEVERMIVAQRTPLVEAKNRIPGMPTGKISPSEYIRRVVAWTHFEEYDGPTEDLTEEPVEESTEQ